MCSYCLCLGVLARLKVHGYYGEDLAHWAALTFSSGYSRSIGGGMRCSSGGITDAVFWPRLHSGLIEAGK